MKAIVYHTYGTPDVLELREVAEPVPSDDEVLVRVRAASVNSWDWDLLTGTPLWARIGGFRKPKYQILGADVAGTVACAGKNVRRFSQGDDVFGDISGSGWGGFAEFVAVRADALTRKPAHMTFEQAAATPQAAVLALQGLRDRGHIERGQEVLINGAGGGVGTFACQIAKAAGCRVTGVDSNEKLDLLRSLGVERVIDFTREDFTEGERRYDAILDVVADHSVAAYRRVLKPDGVCVLVGGSVTSILGAALLGGRKVVVLVHRPNREDLDSVAELFEAGDVIPVVDMSFSLNETADALRRIGNGLVMGKVVITV